VTMGGEWKMAWTPTATHVNKNLQVDGTVATSNSGSEGAPAFTSTLYPTTGMYTHADGVFFAVGGNWKFGSWDDRVVIRHDLQVDGNADLIINAPADAFGRTTRGTVFIDHGLVAGTQGSFGTAMTSNGYRNDSNKWTSLGMNNSVGATVIELLPTGKFYVRAASNHPTGSAQLPPVQFTVNESGPTFRAMPSKTRTVDDVLERAETAEFPPEDDEGVATMDGYDEVPLFEVVSALLAKVKQQGEQIAELQDSTARFDKLESDIALLKAK
jgi:hypothetical protein